VNIKLNENLPSAWYPNFRHLGHDVDTARPDFSHLRRFTPGTHARLLLVRLAQPGRTALATRVAVLFATEHVDLWRGWLVVATGHKAEANRRRKRFPRQDEAARDSTTMSARVLSTMALSSCCSRWGTRKWSSVC
jgi:hypothetical protein